MESFIAQVEPYDAAHALYYLRPPAEPLAFTLSVRRFLPR